MNGEFTEALRDFGLEYFNKYYASYKGVVTDNRDPEHTGRLKINIPQIYGDDATEWAYSKGMPSGKQMGVFAIPNIGDLVWVSFENGDPRYPIWEYGPFVKSSSPDAAKRDNPNNYIFQSPKGQRIELDDEKEILKITNEAGFSVELGKNDITIGRGGDTLRGVLDDLVDIIRTLKVKTAMGPSGTALPDSVLKLNQVEARIKKILGDEFS